jgi:hypothetical protein
MTTTAKIRIRIAALRRCPRSHCPEPGIHAENSAAKMWCLELLDCGVGSVFSMMDPMCLRSFGHKLSNIAENGV